MIDNLTIRVQGGTGGNGCVSFRRERYAPRGGPDGGDGGRGGDVRLRAAAALADLEPLRRPGVWQAAGGGHGQGRGKHGHRGEDLVLEVPVGTVVYDEAGNVLVELVEAGQEAVVAAGGRGGRGNRHFATAAHKRPRFAEEGERGEERVLRLELRMLADVGIVGLPNVGKSSLLAAVSNAKPRIGEYPFSTVEPELGVVELGYERLVWMDVPGLVGGASRGVGMGDRFLQHLMRTRVLVHVVSVESDDPAGDVETVERELERYSEGLLAKPRVYVVNKMDLPGAEERRGAVLRALKPRGAPVFFVSAERRAGWDAVVAAVFRLAQMAEPSPARGVGGDEGTEERVYRPLEERRQHTVRREGNVFVLEGRYLPRVVVAPHTAEGLYQHLLRERIRRTKWRRALEEAGIRPGDRVRVGDDEIEW